MENKIELSYTNVLIERSYTIKRGRKQLFGPTDMRLKKVCNSVTPTTEIKILAQFPAAILKLL